jgi:ribonuclease P protein component
LLSREFRLRSKADIGRVFRQRRFLVNRDLIIKFLPNTKSNSRVAFLVGKKIVKSAVVRNRIKRRLREVARLNLTKIPTGFDLLVIARTVRLREINFGELTQSFLYLIKKIK